jgi:hypothetical protein
VDRRTTPCNGRVAAKSLIGQVVADRYVVGECRRINVGVTGLWRDAMCLSLDRQLLFGDVFVVYEVRNEMAFGQAGKDGYVGYVDAACLGDPVDPTHFVCSRATHLYREPDIKTVPKCVLSFGSSIQIVGSDGQFQKTVDGFFVPTGHVRKISPYMSDPASVAVLFLGTPYLWGGNSCCGIDCSGLIQASLLACGVDCPGDSDLQEHALGDAITKSDPVRRGDLFFWKGHVAMALDRTDLIHANAHHMAVAIEPIDVAIKRIAEQGGGPVTSRRRI